MTIANSFGGMTNNAVIISKVKRYKLGIAFYLS